MPTLVYTPIWGFVASIRSNIARRGVHTLTHTHSRRHNRFAFGTASDGRQAVLMNPFARWSCCPNPPSCVSSAAPEFVHSRHSRICVCMCACECVCARLYMHARASVPECVWYREDSSCRHIYIVVFGVACDGVYITQVKSRRECRPIGQDELARLRLLHQMWRRGDNLCDWPITICYIHKSYNLIIQ